MARDLVIEDAVILPMTEERKWLKGYVRVRDGVITEIAEGPPRDSAPEKRLDARGDVLMPGLVNAHTHLYQVLLRAVWEDLPLMPWLKRIYGTARALRPEHFYAGSLLACLEALKGGVTTVCEHNFLNPMPECAFETVRAVRDSGLRAVFARTIMDTGEIVPECVRETPDRAFARIEELMAHEEKIASPEKPRISFMTGPNTPPINTTPDLLKEIRRFADEKSLGISAHVAESSSVVDYVREKHQHSGVVKFLHDFGIPDSNTIFAHCVHISPDEIQILRQTGTSVSHNPVSNMMLGDGIAPVVELLREGVNVALGTDGAASNHGQDLFETMKAASLLQKVHHRDAAIIDPYTVLRMATALGSHALGLSSICGTIEVGKRADLIIVETQTSHTQPVNDLFSQLVHCAKAGDVRTVIVEGQVLMEDRKALALDEQHLIEDANVANRDLMSRLESLSF